MASQIIFWAAASFILYVLFGYPLLLWILASGSERTVRRQLSRRTVSVLLAVHNGEPFIRQKLASLLALDYPRELIEILVISDGSQDGTDDIVREHAAEGVQLICVPRGGKPAALNAGLERAQGEILFFTDVRQQLAPDSLGKLAACFADPSVGVVSGELIIREGATREESDVGLYWSYEKWIRRRQSRIDSVLGATGAIYAMRRELAVPLPKQTLADDVYLPLAAFFRGYRILLEDSAQAYDDPTSPGVEFHRKVRTLAGVYQVIRAYPALLVPFANRMWIHFVSHKLSRLLLPFALMALFISSLLLSEPWRSVMAGSQLVFYAMAVLDLWVHPHSALKRVSSPIRTFATLMLATLVAASILFRPSKGFWKQADWIDE